MLLLLQVAGTGMRIGAPACCAVCGHRRRLAEGEALSQWELVTDGRKASLWTSNKQEQLFIALTAVADALSTARCLDAAEGVQGRPSAEHWWLCVPCHQAMRAQAPKVPPHLVGSPAALKGEGVGDHTHSEDAHVLGQPGHHRGRAGASAATHARGDEHLRPREGSGQPVSGTGAAQLQTAAQRHKRGQSASSTGWRHPNICPPNLGAPATCCTVAGITAARALAAALCTQKVPHHVGTSHRLCQLLVRLLSCLLAQLRLASSAYVHIAATAQNQGQARPGTLREPGSPGRTANRVHLPRPVGNRNAAC